MEEIRTNEDLMKQILKMNKDESVRQIFIPGKGKFTIVLQEEDQNTIAAEINENPNLKHFIFESIEAYTEGKTRTIKEVISKISPDDYV